MKRLWLLVIKPNICIILQTLNEYIIQNKQNLNSAFYSYTGVKAETQEGCHFQVEPETEEVLLSEEHWMAVIMVNLL